MGDDDEIFIISYSKFVHPNQVDAPSGFHFPADPVNCFNNLDH